MTDYQNTKICGGNICSEEENWRRKRPLLWTMMLNTDKDQKPQARVFTEFVMTLKWLLNFTLKSNKLFCYCHLMSQSTVPSFLLPGGVWFATLRFLKRLWRQKRALNICTVIYLSVSLSVFISLSLSLCSCGCVCGVCVDGLIKARCPHPSPLPAPAFPNHIHHVDQPPKGNILSGTRPRKDISFTIALMPFSQEPVYFWLLKSETHFGSCVHAFSLSASFSGTFSLVKQRGLFAKQIRPVCGSLEPDTHFFSKSCFIFWRSFGSFFLLLILLQREIFIKEERFLSNKDQERGASEGSNIS